MKASPEEIAQRFERIVDYLSDLERGQSALMDAPLALELVARAASQSTPHAKDVLDLGCGAGNYSLKLLQFRPDLHFTLIDLSDILLARAMERLSGITSGSVTPLRGDIRDIDLATERFDITLAGAVLHHLREDAEWEKVFSKVYAALRPGGSFWISDLVEHSIPEVQQIMWSRYGAYLTEVWGAEGRDAVFSEIAEQDSPRPLMFQIDLLRRTGFRNLEVLHKNSCFATFGATKPW